MEKNNIDQFENILRPEINKNVLSDNNVIAVKQQLLGIILCFFMHLNTLGF